MSLTLPSLHTTSPPMHASIALGFLKTERCRASMSSSHFTFHRTKMVYSLTRTRTHTCTRKQLVSVRSLVYALLSSSFTDYIHV